MEIGHIISIILAGVSFVTTVIVALVGWGFRSTTGKLEEAIAKNTADIEKVDVKASKIDEEQTAAIEKLREQFSSFKADLPFVYVTREDYIRQMNNVDKHMGDIGGKLDKLLEKTAAAAPGKEGG